MEFYTDRVVRIRTTLEQSVKELLEGINIFHGSPILVPSLPEPFMGVGSPRKFSGLEGVSSNSISGTELYFKSVGKFTKKFVNVNNEHPFLGLKPPPKNPGICS